MYNKNNVLGTILSSPRRRAFMQIQVDLKMKILNELILF